jgi:hypothetical protein
MSPPCSRSARQAAERLTEDNQAMLWLAHRAVDAVKVNTEFNRPR